MSSKGDVFLLEGMRSRGSVIFFTESGGNKSSDSRYCDKIEAFIAGIRLNDSHGITLLKKGSGSVGRHVLFRLTGTVGGIRTVALEVKFLDCAVTNDCEGIYQGCFH